jgi:hypothetical protein
MDGYIQIKVGDQMVGLKFAYPAIKWFTEASVKDRLADNNAFFVDETDDKGETQSTMSDYGFAKLVQCAYRNDCLLKETAPVLKFEDFVNWVEQNNSEEGKEVLSSVMTCYAESTFSKKIVENAEKKRISEAVTQV